MAFYATDFIFDGIPSEEHGLIISSSDGESYTAGSHNVELITDEIYRRHTPYFYGVRQAQMLDIPGSIRSINGEITQEDASYIQTWLFGQMTFKELRIVQPDMEGYYFKCFLLDPEIVRVGNIIVGFDFRIQLDSPFGYGEEITTEYTNPATSTVTFFNESSNNYYTYPTVIIEIASTGTTNRYAKVTNQSDNNRVFQLGDSVDKLNVSEYIIINNDLQSIMSYTNSGMGTETTDRRIQDLKNSYFFRLKKGVNILYFESVDVAKFIIKYTPLKRII
jgi:hypothetical protein